MKLRQSVKASVIAAIVGVVGVAVPSVSPGSLLEQGPVPTPALQSSLPVGATGPGAAAPGAPVIYKFAATTAGILTVAVHGRESYSVISLTVTDEDGQPVVDGSQAHPLDPIVALQVSPVLRAAGTYLVYVESSGEPTTFLIGAAWLPFPGLAKPIDPDGRPRSAGILEVGKGVDDTLDAAASDAWDWFAIKSPGAGTLTVVTRATEGDVKLEAYTDDYAHPVERSDEDLEGVKGNESVSLPVKAGQTVRVRALLDIRGFGLDKPVKYRITAALLPQ